MIIGLTGKARSGKSTAATYLQGRGFVRVGFADPMRAMLRIIGLGDAELTGALKEKPCALLMGKTPRWALQSLGTEWGRECIDRKLWIAHWQRTAFDVLDHGGKVVVDDIREELEANTVREAGGIVIRLQRTQAATVNDHPTERAEFAADITIQNNSSIDQLHAAINAYLLEG